MIAFIKLIRPINLLIIAFTMFCTGWYFDMLLVKAGHSSKLISLPFIILVVSTILIAAAGNIINDYFDIKADRINRPERLIVGKYIKRRWAILFHWVINFLAFGMAVYLSYIFETFWYLFIHLLSINLLWYYSMHLKRTVVFGNVTIALLTGLVPVLVAIFYNQQTDWENISYYYPFNFKPLHDFPIYIGIGLGLFGFFLNWAREIVKDIEDIKGDKALKAKTLPIYSGIKRAKYISTIILLIPVFLSLFFFLGVKVNTIQSAYDFLPLSIAGLAMLFAFIFILNSNTPKQFRKTHLTIKLIMICGLILPLYWAINLYISN